MFSALVTQHWIPDFPGHAAGTGVRVVIDASLGANRSVSLLTLGDGLQILALSPESASRLSLSDAECVDAARLAAGLAGAGIILNDPDHIFYLPVEDQPALRGASVPGATRRLTIDDEEAFARFAAQAPEVDLDEAFVELDHWLVFGTFVDGRLAAAASMYPWDDTRLADLGVITLPDFRGRGLGRATVRAISAQAIENGYEPQYRCQFDNTGSIALARSAGFAPFGDWQVILPEA